ncbi:MAG: hypothetical protein SFU98_19200 [Leptospiraceae bacterium]|nr:hypothetical protein [Leptospiraceae bacterium]
MKRDYLLIISGIIPILFIFYVLIYFQKDNRKKEYENAKTISKEKINSFQPGEMVRFSGVITSENSTKKDSFILAIEEEKIQTKTRKVWTKKKNFFQNLKIDSNGLKYEVMLSENYVLCGKDVKVVEDKDTKVPTRTLGIESNANLTGYGKLVTIDPILIDAGLSPCAEKEEEYVATLNKKNPSYFLMVLFISIPSLFLVYLGLFKKATKS